MAEDVGDNSAAIRAWVEETLRGTVTRIERQPRWREAYYIDVERDGSTDHYYFRASRDGDTDDLIIREGTLLNVLADHGINVPRSYGFCPAVPGILIDGLRGTDMFHRAPPADRAALAEQFVSELAKWHAIPIDAFAEAGLRVPEDPTRHHLMDLDELEANFRSSIRSDTPAAPLLEFTLKWLRANCPTTAGPAVLVQGDTGPGQFLFEGATLTGVIDWEMAKFGDPMYDLVCIRGRDLSYPVDDLASWLTRYSELSGRPLDQDLLRFHSVRTLIMTPVAIYPMIARGTLTGANAAIYQGWDTVYSRAMVQCLAEAIGIELPPVKLPQAQPTSRSWLFEAVSSGLIDELGPMQTDVMAHYRVGALNQIVGHLAIAEQVGAACDEDVLDAAEALLGVRPPDRATADRMVQDAVLTAGPERDADFVRYFWQDYARREQLLGPLLGELAETATLSPMF